MKSSWEIENQIEKLKFEIQRINKMSSEQMMDEFNLDREDIRDFKVELGIELHSLIEEKTKSEEWEAQQEIAFLESQLLGNVHN